MEDENSRDITEEVTAVRVRTNSTYSHVYKVDNGIDYWAEKINVLSLSDSS